MSKQELINILRASLSGQVPAAVVSENVTYYEDFVDSNNVISVETEEKEYSIPFEAVSKAKLVLTDELWNSFVKAQENNE